MPPFPGMDPYLEAPDIWPDFHDALVNAIRVDLNASLPPPYYARSQKRAELGVALDAGQLRRIIPDVVVAWQSKETASPPTSSVAVIDQPRTEATAGVKLRVHTDPFQHRFVEIRDTSRNHKLITVIEIVSPANKQSGPDRRSYEAKQREILQSDANLIELDLLRNGERLLPYPELVAAIEQMSPNYLILLNRSAERRDTWIDYTLYPVRVRETLPCISVPLAGDDPDVLLDLQVIFNRVYREGPYVRLIDYTAPPHPPLTAEDAAWAETLLQQAGLRSKQDTQNE